MFINDHDLMNNKMMLDRYAIQLPMGYTGQAIGLNQIQFTTFINFTDGNIASIQLYNNNSFTIGQPKSLVTGLDLKIKLLNLADTFISFSAAMLQQSVTANYCL